MFCLNSKSIFCLNGKSMFCLSRKSMFCLNSKSIFSLNRKVCSVSDCNYNNGHLFDMYCTINTSFHKFHRSHSRWRCPYFFFLQLNAPQISHIISVSSHHYPHTSSQHLPLLLHVLVQIGLALWSCGSNKIRQRGNT